MPQVNLKNNGEQQNPMRIINSRPNNRSRKSELFDELIEITRSSREDNTNEVEWENFEKKLNEYFDDQYPYSCDINISTLDYDTVLMLAARAGSIWESSPKVRVLPTQFHIFLNSKKGTKPKMIEYLLQKISTDNEEAINEQDDEYRTALHHAILHRRTDYMKWLIEYKADVNVKTLLKATVLHFACFSAKNDEECLIMLKILYKEPEDSKNEIVRQKDSELARQKDSDNLTAVCIAARRSFEQSVGYLLDSYQCSQHDNCCDIELEYGVRSNNKKILDKIYRQHESCTFQGKDTKKYLLHLAAKFNNNREVYTAAGDNDKDLQRDNVSHKISTEYNPDAWKQPNIEGYTPLHIAAHYGNNAFIQNRKYLEICHTILSLDSKRVKKLLEAVDNDKNTPLHLAARMKSEDIFDRLLECGGNLNCSNLKDKKEDYIYGVTVPRNWLEQTPLFECAKYNRKSFMEKLLLPREANSSKWKQILDRLKDENQNTCLHIACNNGNLEIVQYLVTEHQISVNGYGANRQTPLYAACEGGFVDVVRYLLDYTDADPTIRTAKGYNCLDIAIARHHPGIVKRLLEYSEWRALMESVQYENSDVPITPMRRLIISMPEIAYELIDEHFTTVIGDADQPKHLIKYDYTFIDDHYNICDWQLGAHVGKSGSKLDKWFKSMLTKVNLLYDRHPYTPIPYTILRNHPLMLMSQCNQEKLMSHPLCVALRKAKFRRFSTWVLVLFFLSYIMFMALYTVVVLQMIHPQYYYDLYNSSGNTLGQNIEWDYGFNNDVCRRVGIYLIESGNTNARKTTSQQRYILTLDVLLILFAIKNGLFIIASWPRFIRKTAYYAEALALVLVYVCIRDGDSWQKPLNFRCPIQWELGSIGLLLSWLVLLSYMRYIPWMDVGLYVVMLEVIFLKFLRAIPLLMVLFCGFGFTYYMLLQYETVYATPFEALFRTALSLFDLGYESRLYNSPTGVMYYPVIYFVFILTEIILTILITNMLIGLAVGEIPTLKIQATLQRTKMLYELFFDYEIFHLQLKTLARCLLYLFTCRAYHQRSNSSNQSHRIGLPFSLCEVHVNDEINDDQSLDAGGPVKNYFKGLRDTITEDDIQKLIVVERNYKKYHKEIRKEED
ncbi:unnamed protein product [Adineta steineri]|uniref:Transient receptor potential cation channel subfamily A member 1-like protein n=2 Tax=Adineta steineri TaxID=433720 RepID=A0A819NKQ0_9BILA|nr:unnamed protein product [Adineta steineri]